MILLFKKVHLTWLENMKRVSLIIASYRYIIIIIIISCNNAEIIDKLQKKKSN